LSLVKVEPTFARWIWVMAVGVGLLMCETWMGCRLLYFYTFIKRSGTVYCSFQQKYFVTFHLQLVRYASFSCTCNRCLLNPFVSLRNVECNIKTFYTGVTFVTVVRWSRSWFVFVALCICASWIGFLWQILPFLTHKGQL
jgi:hypothetical protein